MADSLYARRVARERAILDAEVARRATFDRPILAQNSKCSVSLDLPLLHCHPTKACAAVCYAAQGQQAFYHALVKSLAVARLIVEDPDRVARQVVDEAAGRAIRLAGSGELLPAHADLVARIHAYGGRTWGFTRRVDTHRVIPHLIFSLDATTPASVLAYVRDSVPVHRRAYLRRPQDPAAQLEVTVTFPVHGSQTPYVGRVPVDPTDCPETRGRVSGCWTCQRCY